MKYFGTDGFRGRANEELTAEHAFRIGRFLGCAASGGRGRVLIGKDTRRSSYMLEYALAAGVVSSGADAYLLHVTTTASVSYLVRAEGFGFGVMISASHNPFEDNGIKLFSECGEKCADDFLLFGWRRTSTERRSSRLPWAGRSEERSTMSRAAAAM